MKFLTRLKHAGKKGGATMSQKQVQLNKLKSSEAVQTCQMCGNSYILILIKEGDDFNDFGLKHCPFCGLVTDELTGSVVV
jgi:hypothetical protein